MGFASPGFNFFRGCRMRTKKIKRMGSAFIAAFLLGIAAGFISCLDDSHADSFSLSIAGAEGFLRYDRVVIVAENSISEISDTLFDGHANQVEVFQGLRPKTWTAGPATFRLRGFQDSLQTYAKDLFVEEAAGPLTLTEADLRLEHFAYAGSPHVFAGRTFSTKIAMRSDGIPFVAFVEAAQENRVRVMRFDSLTQGWKAVNPEGLPTGSVGGMDLARDAAGGVYLAFTDSQDSGRITVLRTEGKEDKWRLVGRSSVSSPRASELALSIGPNDELYLAFKDDSCELKASVLKYDSSQNKWNSVGSLGFTAGEVLFLSLAISRDGIPYVAYYDELIGGYATVMRYRGESDAWEVVGEAGFTGGRAIGVLQIAEKGVPYLAFSDGHDFQNRATLMQYHEGKGWKTVGTAGFTADQANHLDFAFNGLGDAHIAFSDHGQEGKLTVMRKLKDREAWDIVGIPGFSQVTVWSLSLAIDAAGHPWVAFTEGFGHGVSVMRGLSGP